MKNSAMFAVASPKIRKKSQSVLIHTASGDFTVKIQWTGNLAPHQAFSFSHELAGVVNEHMNLGKY